MDISRRTVEEALAGFAGELFVPGDDGYEAARRVHNGLIDKRPGLVARCAGNADVIDAIGFALGHGLPVSVKGGGHNVAGRAIVEDGVVIDLSAMRGIHVDAGSRIVRAQGGTTWAGFNRETAVHGLATTGGTISSTGIAGLTLGGGFGYLMPKHGLTVDNLRSVELVTAAGEVVTASDEEHPDLFWALRGGGGNFGVATSFEYRLHPLRQVTAGLVAHPFSSARDLLRTYRDLTADLPDELMAMAALVHAPDGSGDKLAAFIVCHAGDPALAEVDLEPFVSWGSPALVAVEPMPYPMANTLLDAGFPAGALNHWKSSFVRSLTDEVIEAVVDGFAAAPSPMSGIVFEHFHGAATRVPVDATAVPHREVGYDLLIVGEWIDPADTGANVAWTRGTYDAVSSAFAGRRYLNYLDDDDPADEAFGPNAARLAQVKRAWDPDNVFRANHNIEPAT